MRKSIHGILQKNKTISSMVTDGLMLYLDAGKTASYTGSGSSWNDLSGNANHAVLQNSPIYSSADGGQLIFNGTNNYATIANTISSDRATMAAWIKRNGNQPIYTAVLVSRSGSATGLLFTSSSNNIGVIWNDQVYWWNPGLTVPNNAWCYVAFTMGDTDLKVYLGTNSGIIFSSLGGTVSGSISMNNIRVASDSASYPRIFNGSIAQIQMYNRALSSSEIEQNFNFSKSIFNI